MDDEGKKRYLYVVIKWYHDEMKILDLKQKTNKNHNCPPYGNGYKMISGIQMIKKKKKLEKISEETVVGGDRKLLPLLHVIHTILEPFHQNLFYSFIRAFVLWLCVMPHAPPP